MLTRTKALFLIPARGGSKGLPGKNLKTLGGIPLVGRSVRSAAAAARQLAPGSRVLCSTDAPDIARAAATWGAEVPYLRPPELATDSAKTMDVVLHALNFLQQPFDVVVLLQPTSPLVEVDDILGAIELSVRTVGQVVSVCETEHPMEWLFKMDKAGLLSSALGSDVPYQRQSATATYRLNGAVYVSSPEALRATGSFLGKTTRGYVMPSERSVDIDSAHDLAMVQAVLSQRESAPISMAGRKIGPGRPCFIIAEAGVNHNGDLLMAIKLIDAAAEAGADAVKFQTFKAERLVTQEAPKAEYQSKNTGADESQFQMLKRLELSSEAHRTLMAHAQQQGVLFLSTPFDEESADFLDGLGVALFKIPSGEITNGPFLEHVARKGKPMIVSTGMSNLAEVDQALRVITSTGLREVAVLQCTSNYPADPADVNLKAMRTLSEASGYPAGYSDHTLGIETSLAAVALGACIIEKHFTLDRNLPGPDHKASLEPQELKRLVEGIRKVELSLGTGIKVPAASEANTASVARKSLVAACDIPMGQPIEPKMLTAKRPGTGLAPIMHSRLVGRKAKVFIPAGTLLSLEMFS